MEDVLWQPLLRDALAALAARADTQVSTLGRCCVACELVSDFEHASLVARAHAPLTEAQRASLDAIVSAVALMQDADLECWNYSVIQRPAWQTLRDLAAQALLAFGWQDAKPQPFVEMSPGTWVRLP